MKRFLAVFLLVFVPSLCYAGEANLVALHERAADLPKKECLSCHGALLKETTSNKKFKTMHRLHLESKRDTPKECSFCHKSVDLREGSAGALRKQVDPSVCSDCHSGGMQGAKVLFAR